jgi:hypothetical protein
VLLGRVARADGELDLALLDVVVAAAEVAARMRSAVDLWNAQNATYKLLSRLPALHQRADEAAQRGAAGLEKLAGILKIAVKR